MKYFLILSVIFLATSCVSPRVADDLRAKNADLKISQDSCHQALTGVKTRNDTLAQEQKRLKDEMQSLKITIDQLAQDTTSMGRSQRRLTNLYESLNATYDRLVSKEKELANESQKKSQDLGMQLEQLQVQLDKKETELNKKEADLKREAASVQKLSDNLALREKKVNELQAALTQKDSALAILQNTVTKALGGFKDQGIEVKEKDGKVYVSMQEKLLFASGKYKVDPKGKKH